MKQLLLISLACMVVVFSTSCSKDDDNALNDSERHWLDRGCRTIAILRFSI